MEELCVLLHKDSDGKVQHHREQRKVITHSDSYNLPYYSTKDVSGVFLLRIDLAQSKKKLLLNYIYRKKSILLILLVIMIILIRKIYFNINFKLFIKIYYICIIYCINNLNKK